jgi:hypothetical protein
MNSIIASLPPRTTRTKNDATGVSFLKLSNCIDFSKLPTSKYGEDYKLVFHHTHSEAELQSINTTGVMSLRLRAALPGASEKVKSLCEWRTLSLLSRFGNDPSLVYTRPLLSSNWSDGENDSIVLAVPPNVTYVFNQQHRARHHDMPADFGENCYFSTAMSLKDFLARQSQLTGSQYLNHFGTVSDYNGPIPLEYLPEPFTPEVPFAEDLIPVTKLVPRSFVRALLGAEEEDDKQESEFRSGIV